MYLHLLNIIIHGYFFQNLQDKHAKPLKSPYPQIIVYCSKQAIIMTIIKFISVTRIVPVGFCIYQNRNLNLHHYHYHQSQIQETMLYQEIHLFLIIFRLRKNGIWQTHHGINTRLLKFSQFLQSVFCSSNKRM